MDFKLRLIQSTHCTAQSTMKEALPDLIQCLRPYPLTIARSAVSTNEQNLIGTVGDTESVTMTVSEGGATNEEMATTTSFASTSQSTSAANFASTSQSTSAAIFTSDNPGTSHTHSPFEGTTSSPLDATSQMPSSNPTTTYVEKTSEPNTHQPPNKVTGTKTQIILHG